MQCKDIPDALVVEGVIAECRTYGSVQWTMMWDLGKFLEDHFGASLPPSLVQAKVRRLIDRKILDGCACGCRGDLEVTEKGREIYEDTRMQPV